MKVGGHHNINNSSKDLDSTNNGGLVNSDAESVQHQVARKYTTQFLRNSLPPPGEFASHNLLL